MYLPYQDSSDIERSKSISGTRASSTDSRYNSRLQPTFPERFLRHISASRRRRPNLRGASYRRARSRRSQAPTTPHWTCVASQRVDGKRLPSRHDSSALQMTIAPIYARMNPRTYADTISAAISANVNAVSTQNLPQLDYDSAFHDLHAGDNSPCANAAPTVDRVATTAAPTTAQHLQSQHDPSRNARPTKRSRLHGASETQEPTPPAKRPSDKAPSAAGARSTAVSAAGATSAAADQASTAPAVRPPPPSTADYNNYLRDSRASRRRATADN